MLVLARFVGGVGETDPFGGEPSVEISLWLLRRPVGVASGEMGDGSCCPVACLPLSCLRLGADLAGEAFMVVPATPIPYGE